ncbi:hypothetical protein NWP17_13345 [Chrysosporum bergii ANA360D]|uniref:Uncharacterized protein n=1 Tax=Chrysosporum bergii ANA360D TaxID=617107 RepID=A0AA43KCB9_9CYAN|nr:hypothetical protein [Chrysosporum bergii]MDH6061409.1 hypothetical protein [Chrysosporum bergii ANA360D]
MSTKNSGKIKFLLSILAVTSFASLNSSAYAETKPGSIDKFLHHANLNTIDPSSINPKPVSVEKLAPGAIKKPVEKLAPGAIKKPGDAALNVACNGACADGVKKPGIDRTNLPQINRKPGQ